MIRYWSSSDASGNNKNKSREKQSKVKTDFDYELDENGNPTLIIPMKDDSIRRIEYDQTLNKWYHEDVFPNIAAPDDFDNSAVRDLNHLDKLAYLKENIPHTSVIELQNEIGKSLSNADIVSVPGFLGKYKDEGMIDIDMKSGLVSFTDAVTNKHRTIVQMTPKKIQKLAENDFHLFPNAGK